MLRNDYPPIVTEYPPDFCEFFMNLPSMRQELDPPLGKGPRNVETTGQLSSHNRRLYNQNSGTVVPTVMQPELDQHEWGKRIRGNSCFELSGGQRPQVFRTSKA
jgi:hypothetical protein